MRPLGRLRCTVVVKAAITRTAPHVIAFGQEAWGSNPKARHQRYFQLVVPFETLPDFVARSGGLVPA